MRLKALFLIPEAPEPGCVEYILRLANRVGNAALKTGRSIGTHAFKLARAGSVTLQNAAQIIEYGRSKKSTVVRTRMRMMVIAEILPQLAAMRLATELEGNDEQKTQSKDTVEGQLGRSAHLQLPDEVQGQHHDHDVRDEIEGADGREGHVLAGAVAR